MSVKGGPLHYEMEVLGRTVFCAWRLYALYSLPFSSCTGKITTIAAQPFKIGEQKKITKYEHQGAFLQMIPQPPIFETVGFLATTK